MSCGDVGEVLDAFGMGVGEGARQQQRGRRDRLPWERPWPRWPFGATIAAMAAPTGMFGRRHVRRTRCFFLASDLRVAKPRRLVDAGRADGSVSVARGRSRERGFTLIEVIIAFALLALALTLLLGTLSGSAREVRWSADAGRAALHAQSLLDQTGVGESLQPGTRDGEFEDGRYRWTLRIEPYADPSQRIRDTVDPAAARLLRLALTMEWGDGGPRQRLELQTLRLAQPDATQGVSL
jgi:general secretion pathway protein I